MTRAVPIPVSIITGFLGAGKTTLLNSLLKHEDMAETAVIINEFGEVGIDHLLVEKADDNVYEMASGCLCCTIRGDLVDTLIDLITRRDEERVPAFNRVVIETTGLANPAPVLHTIMSHDYLLQRFSLAGVICVVDCVNGLATLDAHEEAVRQVAIADRLVLTKADLLRGPAGQQTLFDLTGRLRRLNPAARMLETTTGEAQPRHLFNTALFDANRKTANVDGWLGAKAYQPHARRTRKRAARPAVFAPASGGGGGDGHGHDHGDGHSHDVNRHDDAISAFCLTTQRAISSAGFELFLELLASYHGPNLLRFKAIVKLEDDPQRPLIVHGVQHVFHPPVRLAAWPDEDHSTRLVFITKDIARKELEALFKAFNDPVTGGAEAFRDDTLSLRGER